MTLCPHLARAGKRPYPGFGAYVALQEGYPGQWSILEGATTEDRARAKARLYPGNVRVIANLPGSAPHIGTYYGNRGKLAQ